MLARPTLRKVRHCRERTNQTWTIPVEVTMMVMSFLPFSALAKAIRTMACMRDIWIGFLENTANSNTIDLVIWRHLERSREMEDAEIINTLNPDQINIAKRINDLLPAPMKGNGCHVVYVSTLGPHSLLQYTTSLSFIRHVDLWNTFTLLDRLFHRITGGALDAPKFDLADFVNRLEGPDHIDNPDFWLFFKWGQTQGRQTQYTYNYDSFGATILQSHPLFEHVNIIENSVRHGLFPTNKRLQWKCDFDSIEPGEPSPPYMVSLQNEGKWRIACYEWEFLTGLSIQGSDGESLWHRLRGKIMDDEVLFGEPLDFWNEMDNWVPF